MDFLYEIMKPAVINKNSETPTQTHHEPNMNNNNQANNGQPNNDHSRRFPQFRVSVTLVHGNPFKWVRESECTRARALGHVITLIL